MCIRIAAAIAVLLLVGSHDVSAQAPASAAPCPLAVVPARVKGLDLVGWRKYPDAELGAVFNYRAEESFGADVFLYPASEPLDAQIAGFKKDLQTLKDGGEIDSFEIMSEREVPGIDSQATGRNVVATLHFDNAQHRSHYFLFAIGPQNVKIRVTHQMGRYTDEAVQAFITELLATLPRPALDHQR